MKKVNELSNNELMKEIADYCKSTGKNQTSVLPTELPLELCKRFDEAIKMIEKPQLYYKKEADALLEKGVKLTAKKK